MQKLLTKKTATGGVLEKKLFLKLPDEIFSQNLKS